MKELILASANPGKIKELQTILSPISCLPQSDLGITEAEETGLTFVENALIKARHASRLGKKAALADDSGLVVEALNGAPGIYSSRFAGIDASDEENIDLLLKKLNGIPERQRQAYYFCAIVLLRYAEDPIPIIATGLWRGRILQERRGEQGFGYDPIFYVKDQQCTAAQLAPNLKNALSHRAKALNQFLKQLKDLEV